MWEKSRWYASVMLNIDFKIKLHERWWPVKLKI